MIPHLPARTFYGTILGGVLLGVMSATVLAWGYLASNASRPNARQIWVDVADDFVVPIAAMMGATFGGLFGVAVAIGAEWCFRMRGSASSPPARTTPP